MSVFGRMMEKEHEKIAILMKALSFYSRPETYENPEAVFVFEIPINNDKGAKARKAFEEINDLSLR